MQIGIGTGIKNWIVNRYGLLLLAGSICTLGLTVPAVHLLMQPLQESPIQESPYLRIDPDKIVLSDRDDRVPCGECHVHEYDAWKSTKHSTGFDEMHRSAQAQSILERMDFRLAKRESLCLRCHYTAKLINDEARAIAGVSCESCHGAARDWVQTHNNYDDATHDTETPEHALQRAQTSADNGMLRPSNNLYGVAANCFECHTVPSEELVNTGRHPSGSKFELVEWSEKIRHNFLQAQWSSDETNHERTDERKRLMYVVGRILDYEYSLRGAAEATEEGSYAKAMERRVAVAVRELQKISALAEIEQLLEVLRLHGDVRLVPGNKDALLEAAEQVRTLGQQFTETHDGSMLASLDPLVRGENVPLPAPEPPPTGETAGDAEAQSGADPAASTAETPAAESPATPPPPAVQVSGEKRTRPAWFTDSPYETTLPGCNCHSGAWDWLYGHPHSGTANILLEERPRAVQIAQIYGLTPAQMKQGNQICMQCHGTIATGFESGEVFDGVTCESCHGPSSEYLTPHKTGQGFQHGLLQLKQAPVFAASCANCHHITEERLLASGHSSGAGFNVATAHNAIVHWPDPTLERGSYPDIDPGALGSAYAGLVQQRPVPRVEVVTLPATPPAPAVSRSASAASRSPSGSSADASPSAPPALPRTRPVPRSAPAPANLGIDLPPLPTVTDSTTTEDILLIVKRRLELLYNALGRDE